MFPDVIPYVLKAFLFLEAPAHYSAHDSRSALFWIHGVVFLYDSQFPNWLLCWVHIVRVFKTYLHHSAFDCKEAPQTCDFLSLLFSCGENLFWFPTRADRQFITQCRTHIARRCTHTGGYCGSHMRTHLHFVVGCSWGHTLTSTRFPQTVRGRLVSGARV